MSEIEGNTNASMIMKIFFNATTRLMNDHINKTPYIYIIDAFITLWLYDHFQNTNLTAIMVINGDNLENHSNNQKTGFQTHPQQHQKIPRTTILALPVLASWFASSTKFLRTSNGFWAKVWNCTGKFACGESGRNSWQQIPQSHSEPKFGLSKTWTAKHVYTL